jgi:4-carboxymuconolactone decarboxylase
MARIPQITTKADLPADKQVIFDTITQSRGRIAGPFGILLNSPDVASRVAHLGHYLRFDSVLPADIRELAIITTARQMDSQYEWTAHAPLALKAGVRQEAIDAVGKRTAPAGLTPDEAMVVRFGQELWQHHKVSDTTFQAALARFGKQGVTELTALIGYYGMVACVLNTFEVPLDPDMQPLLPQ